MINGADIYIRFLNGDKEAFVELIREYKSGLLLFINTLDRKSTRLNSSHTS